MATYSTTAGHDHAGFGSRPDRSPYQMYVGERDGFGSDRVPVDRPGHAVDGAGATTETEYKYRMGQFIQSIQSVGELVPESVCRGTAPTPRGYDAVTGSYMTPLAAYIPSAYFRRVHGVALNEDMEPITNAVWVIAQDGLPTAAEVDDNGEFHINILRTDYERFALLVKAEQYDGLDYVWYQYQRTVVDTATSEIALVFKESEITSGINVGMGVSMG